MALEEGNRLVSVSGPEKFVASALAAVEGVHRQHARQQEPVDLAVEETGLVRLHLKELKARMPRVGRGPRRGSRLRLAAPAGYGFG